MLLGTVIQKQKNISEITTALERMHLPKGIILSIADAIITKTGFKTLSIAAGHELTQAAYFGGGVFPFIFFLERELSKWQEAAACQHYRIAFQL